MSRGEYDTFRENVDFAHDLNVRDTSRAGSAVNTNHATGALSPAFARIDRVHHRLLHSQAKVEASRRLLDSTRTVLETLRRTSMNTLPYQQAFDRIRAEFMEMPGMRLTPDQVERLSGVPSATCKCVLDDLVRAGFLHRSPSGSYGRSSETSRPTASADHAVRRTPILRRA